MSRHAHTPKFNKYERGFTTGSLSLMAIGFLTVSLITVTAVINNQNFFINLFSHAATKCSSSQVYCAGCGGFCLDDTSKVGCNVAQEQKCGQQAQYGSTVAQVVACPGNTQCTCSGNTVCFNTTGDCDNAAHNGLCALYTPPSIPAQTASTSTSTQTNNSTTSATITSSCDNCTLGSTQTCNGTGKQYCISSEDCTGRVNAGNWGGCVMPTSSSTQNTSSTTSTSGNGHSFGSINTTTTSNCVGIGGTVASGMSCCIGLVRTNCTSSGSFSSCKCESEPAPTAQYKICTIRNCSDNSCVAIQATVTSDTTCKTSSCVTDSDCKSQPTTATNTTTPLTQTSCDTNCNNTCTKSTGKGGSCNMNVCICDVLKQGAPANGQQALTNVYTGLNNITGGDFANYVSSYSPENVTYGWQQMGYKSADDCAQTRIKTSASAALLCGEPVYTKQQLASTVKLGTTLTSEGALAVTGVGAIGDLAGVAGDAVGGAAAKTVVKQLAKTGLEALARTGPIGTLQQTGNTAATCIIDPKTGQCAEQAVETAFSWATLSLLDKLTDPNLTAAAKKILQVANVGTGGIMIGTSGYNTIQVCTGPNKSVSGCIVSSITTAGTLAMNAMGLAQSNVRPRVTQLALPDPNVIDAEYRILAPDEQSNTPVIKLGSDGKITSPTDIIPVQKTDLATIQQTSLNVAAQDVIAQSSQVESTALEEFQNSSSKFVPIEDSGSIEQFLNGESGVEVPAQVEAPAVAEAPVEAPVVQEPQAQEAQPVAANVSEPENVSNNNQTTQTTSKSLAQKISDTAKNAYQNITKPIAQSSIVNDISTPILNPTEDSQFYKVSKGNVIENGYYEADGAVDKDGKVTFYDPSNIPTDIQQGLKDGSLTNVIVGQKVSPNMEGSNYTVTYDKATTPEDAQVVLDKLNTKLNKPVQTNIFSDITTSVKNIYQDTTAKVQDLANNYINGAYKLVFGKSPVEVTSSAAEAPVAGEAQAPAPAENVTSTKEVAVAKSTITTIEGGVNGLENTLTGGVKVAQDPVKTAEAAIADDYKGTMARLSSKSSYKPESSVPHLTTDLDRLYFQQVRGVNAPETPPSFQAAIADPNYGSNPYSDAIIKANSWDEVKTILNNIDVPLEAAPPGFFPNDNVIAQAFLGKIYVKAEILDGDDLALVKPIIAHEATHIWIGDQVAKADENLGKDGNDFSTLLNSRFSMGSEEDLAYVNQARAAISELENNPNLTAAERVSLQKSVTDSMKFYNWVTTGDVLPQKPSPIILSFDENVVGPVDSIIHGTSTTEIPTDSTVVTSSDATTQAESQPAQTPVTETQPKSLGQRIQDASATSADWFYKNVTTPVTDNVATLEWKGFTDSDGKLQFPIGKVESESTTTPGPNADYIAKYTKITPLAADSPQDIQTMDKELNYALNQNQSNIPVSYSKTINSLIEKTDGPLIEIGGPTLQGFRQIDITTLKTPITVSNVTDGLPLYDWDSGVLLGTEGKVDRVIDATNMNLAPESVGAFYTSAPNQDIIPQFLQQSFDALKPGGVVILDRTDSSWVLPEANKLGFRVIEQSPEGENVVNITLQKPPFSLPEAGLNFSQRVQKTLDLFTSNASSIKFRSLLDSDGKFQLPIEIVSSLPEPGVIIPTETNIPSDLTQVTAMPDGEPFVSAEGAYQAESSPALTRRITDIENEISNLDAQKVAQIVYDAKYTDGLTGLVNRTGFTEGLNLEVANSAENGTDLTVITMDLKQFKNINDTFGHATGDDALKLVAQILSDNVRSTDLAVRISGDEFALILPQTDEEGAQTILQRIQSALDSQKAMASSDSFIQNINIDAGVKQWSQSDNVSDFLKDLDSIMYEQKRSTSAAQQPENTTTAETANTSSKIASGAKNILLLGIGVATGNAALKNVTVIIDAIKNWITGIFASQNSTKSTGTNNVTNTTTQSEVTNSQSVNSGNTNQTQSVQQIQTISYISQTISHTLSSQANQLNNFSVFMQTSNNTIINQADDTLTYNGCAPSTAYNILKLTGKNPDLKQIIQNFYWNCSGNKCTTSADATLLALQQNGLTGTYNNYETRRITDANQLKNYSGILVYGGTVSTPQEKVAHVAGFSCQNGNCSAIDSYFSDGKPIPCNIIDSKTVKCGDVKYNVGNSGGIPDAFYPVTGIND